MKSLVACQRNFLRMQGRDGVWFPLVEVALGISEPSYVPLPGEPEGRRVEGAEQIRFVADPETLRWFAELLIGYADTADTIGAFGGVPNDIPKEATKSAKKAKRARAGAK